MHSIQGNNMQQSRASSEARGPAPVVGPSFLLRQDDYLPYEQEGPTMTTGVFMRSELFYEHEAAAMMGSSSTSSNVLLLRSELYYPQLQQAEEEHVLMRSEMHYSHDYPLLPLSLMRSELHYPHDKGATSRVPRMVRSEQYYPQNAQDNELLILYLQTCAVKVQSFSRMARSRGAYLRAKSAAAKLISIGRIFLAKKHVLALLANARNMAATAVTSTDMVLLDTTTTANTIVLSDVDVALVWSQFTLFTLRKALLHAAAGKVFSNDIEALVMSFCLQSNLLQLPDSSTLVVVKKKRNATPPFSVVELVAFASIIYHMLKEDGRFEVKTWAPRVFSPSSSSKESNSLVLFTSSSTTSSEPLTLPSQASFNKFCLWCFGTVRSIEDFVERLQFLGISLSLNDDGRAAASLAVSRRRVFGRQNHRRNGGTTTNSLLRCIWVLFASYQGPCNEDCIVRYNRYEKKSEPNDFEPNDFESNAFDKDKENEPAGTQCCSDDEITFLG